MMWSPQPLQKIAQNMKKSQCKRRARSNRLSLNFKTLMTVERVKSLMPKIENEKDFIK